MMSGMASKVVDGWVPVSEIRQTLGDWSDTSHEVWAETFGVAVRTDWRGRPVVASPDAARIMEQVTSEAAVRVDEWQALHEGHGAYLADYDGIRHATAAFCDGAAREHWRVQDEAYTRRQHRAFRVIRIGSYGTVADDAYPLSPRAKAAGRAAYSEAFELFGEIVPAPLDREAWDRAGRPARAVEPRRKTMATVISRVLGISVAQAEKHLESKGWDK